MRTVILPSLSGFFVLVAIVAGYGFFLNVVLGKIANSSLCVGGAMVAVFFAVFTVVYGAPVPDTELETDTPQEP